MKILKKNVVDADKNVSFFVVFYSMDQSISFLAEPGTVSETKKLLLNKTIRPKILQY